MNTITIRRRHLATFDNAYAVAVRLKESTGDNQYVVSNPDAAQPFRVLTSAPRDTGTIVSLIA